MWTLALACAFFLSIHVLISGSRLKEQLVDAIGAGIYKLLFALLSLGGFFWMVTAFFGARSDPFNHHFWEAPFILKTIAFVFNFVGLMLLIVGALSPSPTNLKGARHWPDEPVSGIIRISRHPVLAGIALLSATHLVCNGNLAAWVFFGTLLALSLLGANSIDRKREAAFGDAYASVMRRTSIVPFLAIFQGRVAFEPAELGVLRVMVATSAFTVLVVLHELLFLRPAL
ncbi:NnrU family protein [Asticcacaulis sp. BYS171W]|uniref:NnrU family protein n=1 Tax=Asticcacaulis aquaticus TaxID=2984212 RepID=A0ABT5HUE3_9CAUL|nr:NnrU family protein [Asticcacaulis aquaticus]MDC7683465.1 NnrU family protein [Asticcacaulis aquaticus]